MFKNQITEYSKDQDACFAWLEIIETSTWEDLADQGQFPLMDKAMGEGLETLLNRVQLSNLKLWKEQARVLKQRIRGRQIAHMIWHSFAITLHNADKIQKQRLENVHLHGDRILEFLNEWDTVVMYFGGVFPDQEWMEQLFRDQLQKSKNFEMQMTMYYQKTAYAEPIQPYSMQRLYDTARRFVAQREHQRLMRPIKLDSGHARAAISTFSNSMDQIIAKGHCKQQAMFGKCSNYSKCPMSHINYPMIQSSTKTNMRQLPGARRPTHNNMRSRPNKVLGINVPRSYSRSTSTNGNRILSRTSSGRSANEHGSRSGRADSRQSRSGRRPDSPRSSRPERGRSTSARGKAFSTTEVPKKSQSPKGKGKGKSGSNKGSRKGSSSVSSTGFKSGSGASRSSSGYSSNFSSEGSKQICRKWTA